MLRLRSFYLLFVSQTKPDSCAASLGGRPVCAWSTVPYHTKTSEILLSTKRVLIIIGRARLCLTLEVSGDSKVLSEDKFTLQSLKRNQLYQTKL
jgi:hypothetical protein